MNIKVLKTELEEMQGFRSIFLQEANMQFIHNAFHERGWSDCYLVIVDSLKVGYAAVCGKANWKTERTTIFEFYLIPPFKKMTSLIFPKLLAVPGVEFIECQSNDLLLTSMLYEFSKNINAVNILFEDHSETQFTIPGAVFRLRKDDDIIFEHKVEGAGEYVLEINGEIGATGGFLLHYNLPFSDLYMEVKEDCRKKGLGSFILQELKKASYQAGRRPCARCNIDNKASKATLLKAGLKVCGYGLSAEVNR